MKNKKGKKLVVLGAMAALLTLIGVSGSQTYAKYIESTTVKSTQATVAKWGFVQNTETGKLFGEDYGLDSGTLSSIEAVSGTNITISSVTADSNVVAPGSTGYMTYSIDGLAEVDFEVRFTVDDNKVYDILLDDGIAGHDDYLPLLWTVTYDATATSFVSPVHNTKSGSLAEVLNYLEMIVINLLKPAMQFNLMLD